MYVLNLGAQNIGIYSIGANGELAFVKYTAPGVCTGTMATDITGNYLYAGNCDADPLVYHGFNGISGYVINHTTGDLTPTPGSPYTYPAQGSYSNYAIPRALAVTP